MQRGETFARFKHGRHVSQDQSRVGGVGWDEGVITRQAFHRAFGASRTGG